MRSKTVILALLTLAGQRDAARSRGAGAAQIKIGVVNVSRLLQEAPQAQAASAALEDEFAPRRRDLENTAEATSRRARTSSQKDGAVDGRDRAPQRREDAARRPARAARKQNEFLEDLNVRRNEALGQLQRTVLQEVQTYAKTAGLRHRRGGCALREPVARHHQPGARGAAGPRQGRRGAAQALSGRPGRGSTHAGAPRRTGGPLRLRTARRSRRRSSSASRRCRTQAPARSRSWPTRAIARISRDTRASAVVLDARTRRRLPGRGAAASRTRTRPTRASRSCCIRRADCASGRARVGAWSSRRRASIATAWIGAGCR